MTPSSAASRPSAPSRCSSSRPGVAILHADGLTPGDKVAGILSLTNQGDKPGALALAITGRRDRPGVYGGRLGNVLRLKVEDLSGRTPARESVVNQASRFALGTLAGRATRTYRVTATFPDGGIPPTAFTGDNALQGASVELALQWNLTAADPGPDPRRPPATPVPAPADPTLPPGTGKRPLLLTLRVPKQRVLKPRGLKAYAECEIACKVRFTARIDNAPVKKKGKKLKKRKTIQKKKVLKGERKWRKLRAGREQRVFLKMRPKARRKLKQRLHTPRARRDHGHRAHALGRRQAHRQAAHRDAHLQEDRPPPLELRRGGGHQLGDLILLLRRGRAAGARRPGAAAARRASGSSPGDARSRPASAPPRSRGG